MTPFDLDGSSDGNQDMGTDDIDSEKQWARGRRCKRSFEALQQGDSCCEPLSKRPRRTEEAYHAVDNHLGLKALDASTEHAGGGLRPNKNHWKMLFFFKTSNFLCPELGPRKWISRHINTPI